jgi:hypothetical protein
VERRSGLLQRQTNDLRVVDLANRLGNCSVARNDQSEMIDGTRNRQQHLADAWTEGMTMASGGLSTVSNDHPTRSQRDLDTILAEQIRALHSAALEREARSRRDVNDRTRRNRQQ